MAARPAIAASDFGKAAVPPDPYSGDPFSSFYVLFRRVEGWPGYGVDTDGNVWSCRKPGNATVFAGHWRKLRPVPHSRGYRQVSLGHGNRFLVQWLILEAFVGPRPEGMEACHNNGRRDDNRLTNLRWDTRPGNFADKLAHGTSNRGAKHGHARLTEADVIQIREMRAAGRFFKEIAACFGIHETTAGQIASGKRWGHL